MSLQDFPRYPLAHLPTPLQPLERLSALLGGPQIWIKRDDCTGLGLGGNKVRKLEYLVADALKHGATHLLTAGPLQSNHCRQTAAAAAKAGLECVLVIDDRLADADHNYRTNGNLLLDRLLGASFRVVAGGTDLDAELQQAAGEVKSAGGVPYTIPVGASAPIGALGYVNAALELQAQADSLGLQFDHVFHATGSAGTQSGLLAGHALLNSKTRIHGVDILGGPVRERVDELTRQTLSLIGHSPALLRGDDVIVHEGFVGDGFGKPTPGMLEALDLLGRQEAILLDPVHTGKAMAGLLEFVRQGAFGKDETLLFIHTGGQPSLFAYADLWSRTPIGHSA